MNNSLYNQFQNEPGQEDEENLIKEANKIPTNINTSETKGSLLNVGPKFQISKTLVILLGAFVFLSILIIIIAVVSSSGGIAPTSPPTFGCDGGVTSAEFKIEGKLLNVPCEDGWVVMQKRGQFKYKENFYRNFAEYEKGFGKIGAEFWLGLDNLAVLTAEGTWQLRVDITDWDEQKYFSRYDSFRVGPGPLYVLRVSGYDKSSSGGDSLTNPKNPEWAHNGMAFTTFDRDKDTSTRYNCAVLKKGGWWYNECYQSNLNGINYSEKRYAHGGITWEFGGKRGDGLYTLKEATMRIRRIPDPIESTTRRV